MNNQELISQYLDPLNIRVKKQNQKFIQVSCPICDEGDSHYKARGFIMGESRGYFCHNCSASMSFYSLLKEFDTGLAKQYLRKTKLNFRDTNRREDSKVTEVFGEGSMEDTIKDVNKIPNPHNLIYREFTHMFFSTTENDEQIIKELELTELTDLAIDYLHSRGFTKDDYKDWKYCPDRGDVVIPFWINKSKNLIYGLQSRNITEKIFHNQFFESNPKVTNLEHILSLPKGSSVYGFEAEFDRVSSGIKDSVAVLGGKFSEDVKSILSDYDYCHCGDADKVGDEKSMELAKAGYKCLIHDKMMYEFKDFNALLQLGQSKENIKKYILDNIQGSKRAYMELRRKM